MFAGMINWGIMSVMKKRTRRAIVWFVIAVIVIAAVYGALVKWPVSTWRGIWNELSGKPIIPVGWVNYQNSDYGFSLYYPPDWQVFTGQLQNDVPAVLFGNPIEGTSTYTLRASIGVNNKKFSSAEYVANMLGMLKAEDEANGTNSPQLSAQFARANAFATDLNDGYELDNVFEFDHNAEQVYVAHGNEIFIFDFPVVDANPNISSPAENNAIAHEILKTLMFIKQTGSPSVVSVTLFDPVNATYSVNGQPVTLVGGKAATAAAPGSAETTTTMIFGEPTSGDLNGDGKADAAVVLTQDSGGSGTFYYVAAAINTGSGTVGTNAILLGDRIAPQNILIQNGEIIANYADRNPGEPMTTSPSVGVSKYFVVNGSTLQATSSPLGK